MSPPRVLVVDNDPEMLIHAAAATSRARGSRWPARRGARGPRRHRDRADYDVILTDLIMDDVGGLEVSPRPGRARPPRTRVCS